MIHNKIGLIILLSIVSTILYANTNYITLPDELRQNITNYTNSNEPLLSKEKQNQNLFYFKQQYFSPWQEKNNQHIFCYVPGVNKTCISIKSLEEETARYYQDNSGYISITIFMMMHG